MVPGHHPEAQVEQLPGRVHPPRPRKRLEQWQTSVAAMKGETKQRHARLWGFWACVWCMWSHAGLICFASAQDY